MKRLTEKNEFGDYVGANLLDDECLCRGLSFDEANEMTECFNKLGKLEDIEEELGIDLLTIYKSLKNGVWYVDVDESLNFGKVIPHSLFEFRLVGHVLEFYLPFAKYGISWALTKEELEWRYM